MTTFEIVVAVAVTALGAFVQGSVGFGLNLIAAPILLLIDDRFVPGPAVAGSMLLTFLVAVRDRRGFDFRAASTAMIGRVPATLLAGVAIAVVPRRPMSVLFAVLVLASVLILASGRHVEINRRTLIGAGAASGFMGTITSIGGPPMAMLLSSRGGASIRGTTSGFFLVGGAFTMGVLVAAGALGSEDLGRIAVLVPGTVVGFAASGRGARWLDAGRTRPAVLVVATLSAISVIVKAAL